MLEMLVRVMASLLVITYLSVSKHILLLCSHCYLLSFEAPLFTSEFVG